MGETPLRCVIANAFAHGERLGLRSERLGFGPIKVDLAFHGESLRRTFMPAIQHARADEEADEPDVRIYALDSATGGIPAVPQLGLPRADPRQTEWHMARDGDLCLQFIPEYRVMTAYDATTQRGLFWCEDAGRLPFWDVGAPFKTLLHWASSPTDCSVFHAGALSDGRRGALLIGAGGSGKSTTVAAGVEAGLETTGDDLVLVEHATGQRAAVHALFDGVKLDAWARAALPSYAGAPYVDAGEKRLCRFAGGPFAPRFRSTFGVDAILLPRVSGGSRTEFSPSSPAEALRALAPATVFLMRGFGERTIAKASALTRSTPAYRVTLGRDPQEAATAVAAWLGALP